MTHAGKLCAWIEKRCNGFLAAFVGEDACARLPATRLFASPDEARQWVEVEAAAFGLPVKWVNKQSGGR
jgi:hypothetical protein